MKSGLMKAVLVPLAISALAVQAMADGVFISEYIEGSSYNKAIEIYNGTAGDVDLSTYMLKLNTNANVVWNDSLALSGTLGAGEVLVLSHASADSLIQLETDINDGVINHNGDDAYGLFDSGVLIDLFGVFGEDPGAGWPAGGEDTQDNTLVRNGAVTEGVTTFDGDEWIAYPINTFDYLGSHSTGGNVPPVIANIELTPEIPGAMDAVSVAADLTDSDGTVVSAVLDWGIAADALTNQIAMSVSVGDTWVTDSDIPGQVGGTEVFYQITATDDDTDTGSSSVESYLIPGDAITIADIQGLGDVTPYDGQVVTTSGLVTGVYYNGYFLQDAEAVRSGIYVYAAGDPGVALGDEVNVTGTAGEYNGLTQIQSPATTVVSSGNTLWNHITVTLAGISEDYESVMINVVDVTCSDPDLGYGEWEITDGVNTVVVDDMFFAYVPVLDEEFDFVRGPLTYSYSAFKIEPVSADDVEAAPTEEITETVDPGDLIVTEIMQNPSSVLDGDGEWFEVYVAADSSLDLNGIEIKDNGSNTFTITSALVVEPGDYVLFSINADELTNGGLPTVDYEYPSSFALSNGDDEVIIMNGLVTIDEVYYDGGTEWPDPSGNSMFLVDLMTDNNVGGNWMTDLYTQYADGGDWGTPGAVNSTPTTAPIVTNVAWLPVAPTPSDDVVVTCDATDTNGSVTDVTLYYSIDGGTIYNPITMALPARDTWTGTIPMQIAGTTVQFYITAIDDELEETTTDEYTYDVVSLDCVDIADLQVLDGDFLPVMLGDIVQLCGVVTVAHEFGAPGPGYLQHATGSMAFYGSAFTDDLLCQIGDEVTMTGEVAHYAGLTEIYPSSFEIVNSGNDVTSATITIPDIGEAYEAQLVSIENVTFETPGQFTIEGSGYNFTAWSGTDTLAVRVDRDIAYTIGALEDQFILPGEPTTITGVIGQYDPEAPHDTGYQFLVRSQDDVPITGNISPAIANIQHQPAVPASTDDVTVSADITDDSAVVSASLIYTVDGGGANTVAMSNVSGTLYEGTIPMQADGSLVEYYIEATDDEPETTTSDVNSYTVADDPCVPFADLRAVDVNGVPLMEGQTVQVCGVLTAAFEFGSSGPGYLQTAEGGVALYGGAFADDSTLAIGDEITMIGVVDNYNGLTEIIDGTDLVDLGPATPVVPTTMTLTDFYADAENIEGMLIRLDGVTITGGEIWPTEGNNANVTIDQGGETITLRIDYDTDIDGSAQPADPFNVVGVIGQYDFSSPYTEGYQIIPRSLADINPTGAVAAPVIDITFDAGNVTVSWTAVEGATDYRVYTSLTPYGGWDAGTLTGGVTEYTTVASGVLFFQVIAID